MVDASKKRVGITGANGLLGWHTRCFALTRDDVDVVTATRETFESSERLRDFVAGCDAIIHYAGVNRGEESEVEAANPAIARQLIEALEASNAAPHVLYSSSTHAEHDTFYGRSKRIAGELFQDWSDRHAGEGARFTNMVLPHVFGECGKPFYNSVVSTFCHEIAKGNEPNITQDGQLELVHCQDVAARMFAAIDAQEIGVVRVAGHPLKVSEMLAKVTAMAAEYTGGIIPDLRNAFDLQLFNTYRSYLFPDYYPVALTLNTDERGALFEAVKTQHGGQAFLSTTKPGITRGNHFHFNKIERFLVVQGTAKISLRRLFDDTVVEFDVDGDEPVFIDMPTLHTHNIINTGDNNTLTLFWSHELFDPENPDTLFEPVERSATS